MNAEDILNAAAEEEYGDDFDILKASSQPQELDISSALNAAADDVLGNDMLNFRPNRVQNGQKNSTSSILKNAAKQVTQEGIERANEVFNAAALSVENDNDLMLNVDALLSNTSPQLNNDTNDDVNFLIDDMMNNSANNTLNNTADTEDDKEEDDEDEALEEDEEEESDPSLDIELRHCCYTGNLSRVEKMVDKGVKLTGVDRHGWTCLHWTVSKGHYEIAELILRSVRRLKSFVNAKESLSGWTALHIACIRGYKECITTLLQYKAKKKIFNLFKETPLQCISASRKSPEGRTLRRLLGEIIPEKSVAKNDTEKTQKKNNNNNNNNNNN